MSSMTEQQSTALDLHWQGDPRWPYNYIVFVDDQPVASVRANRSVNLPITPGRHKIRLDGANRRSNTLDIAVENGAPLNLEAGHRPMIVLTGENKLYVGLRGQLSDVMRVPSPGLIVLSQLVFCAIEAVCYVVLLLGLDFLLFKRGVTPERILSPAIVSVAFVAWQKRMSLSLSLRQYRALKAKLEDDREQGSRST